MSEQQHARNPFDSDSASEGDDIWRKEIQSRVDGYRTRRGRRIEGAYSMRFPFPPPADAPDQETDPVPGPRAVAPPAQILESVLPAFEVRMTATAEPPDTGMPQFAQQQVAAVVQALEAAEAPPQSVSESLNEPPAELRTQDIPASVAALPRPRTRRKVIAFPRHLMATPDIAYRLADPVVPEQPRILDVPEELEAPMATPFLDGLTFDGKIAHTPIEQVELPFRPACAAQRGYAILIDVALVAAGSAIFAAVGWKMMPKVIFSKPVLATAAAIPVLLWFVYQFLLLVYGGATPGMRLARVRLLSFTGKIPTMRQRRNRVLGLVLSTASLAMGLLWAFVDVDSLCWHDRMSQTFLTSL